MEESHTKQRIPETVSETELRAKRSKSTVSGERKRERVWLITHKYRGSQQFSRVEYSTQIYLFDTRGAKEYSQVLSAKLSIQLHLKDLTSIAKYLVAK